MKKLGLLITGAAMLFGAGTASAGTIPSGFYVGGSLGYDTSDVSTSTDVGTGYFAGTSVTSIEAQQFDLDDDGFNGGVQGGAAWVTPGGFGWGIEADWTFMDRNASDSNTVVYPCCGPTAYTYAQEIEENWLATVRARLGWDLGGIFVYGTAGAAFGDVSYSHTFSDTYTPVAALTYSNSETMTGWAGGLGAETSLGGAMSVKAEYLHVDLGDIDTGGTIFGGGPRIDSTASVESDLFRVGLNWHF